MSKKHPIDELFKQKLEGHKIAPSEATWEKIALATQAKSSGFKPMYLMRAAAVVLLMGVSGLMYFQNNTERIVKPVTQEVMHQQEAITPEKIEEIKLNEEVRVKEEPAVSAQVQEVVKSTKTVATSAQANNAKAAKKAISTKQNTVAVAAKTEIIESEVELPVKEIEVQTRKVADWKPSVDLKLKAIAPVTEEWITESDVEKEEHKKLKDKVFAYANDQVNNLLAGKKLNFPKTPKGKPSLEINLEKLLN